MNNIDYSIHYGRFHSDTEDHAADMAKAMKDLLKPHLPDNRDAPILDIGCGYGFALRGLRDLGYKRLLGIETSPQQAKRCRDAGFEVAVVEDTVKWLQDHEKQFAFVVLLDVLEHIPVNSQIQFARAVYGVFQSAGKLIVTVPNANSILAPRWRYIDYTHHSSFTEHSLYFVLKNAGFDNIWIDSSKGIGRFPLRLWRRSGWERLRKWLVRWMWLQVIKAEIPWERIDEICFELNLKAVATKQ